MLQRLVGCRSGCTCIAVTQAAQRRCTLFESLSKSPLLPCHLGEQAAASWRHCGGAPVVTGACSVWGCAMNSLPCDMMLPCALPCKLAACLRTSCWFSTLWQVGPGPLDLGSLESVRGFAEAYRRSGKGLDVLVRCAALGCAVLCCTAAALPELCCALASCRRGSQQRQGPGEA